MSGPLWFVAGLTLIPFTLAVTVLAAATYGHHLNRKRSK